MTRISLVNLRLAPAECRPAVDPASRRVRIVHLGVGAFHRAHQATFIEDSVAEADWGICGVTQRSNVVIKQLAPQDGLYTVLERTDGGYRGRLIGTVRELLSNLAEPAKVTARIADPNVQLVTLTVTEKAYRHDPATRRLQVDDEVASDLCGRPPRTVVGQLVAGLRARRAAGAGPLTVISCDNLPDNGGLLRGLVEEFCSRSDAEPSLGSWIAESVTFPSSVVDRITPTPTVDDRRDAARLLGCDDHAAVATEPFRQWVIESNFAAARPPLEEAGAMFVADISPYETMKLRLLNATHSALAYVGGVAGFELISDAVGDERLDTYARRLLAHAQDTVAVPQGFDVVAYSESILERFANPAVRYRTAQVAADGTHKLPQRLVATIRELRATGRDARYATLAVAAWMRYVSAGRSDTGAPITVDDPMADQLALLAPTAAPAPQVVRALLSLTPVFGDLQDDDGFVELVTDDLDGLTRHGAISTLESLLR